MELQLGNTKLAFLPVKLSFQNKSAVNTFARKNDKTLGETLQNPRYRHLVATVQQKYQNAIEEKLGEFLLRLKLANDPFYLRFLNRYGDAIYCKFSIQEPTYLPKVSPNKRLLAL